jgi:hypothetical protein
VPTHPGGGHPEPAGTTGTAVATGSPERGPAPGGAPAGAPGRELS